MQLYQLNYFLTLAKKLNYTATADALYIAQPTLSRMIVSLENELGTPLFERNKQNVKLTHAGETFLAYAERILADYNEALICTRASADGKRGIIKIGISSVAFSAYLPLVVRRFRRLHPDVVLQAQDGTVETLLQQIDSKSLDIAFTRDFLTENYPDTDKMSLWSDPIYAVVAPDHPLAAEKAVSLLQLKHENFFAVDRTALMYPPLKDFIGTSSTSGGGSPSISVQLVSSPTRILSFVESGLGVALLHQHIRNTTKSNCVFLPLKDYDQDPEISIHYDYNAVAVWSTKNRNPCLPFFLQAATQSLDEYYALRGAQPGFESAPDFLV